MLSVAAPTPIPPSHEFGGCVVDAAGRRPLGRPEHEPEHARRPAGEARVRQDALDVVGGGLGHRGAVVVALGPDTAIPRRRTATPVNLAGASGPTAGLYWGLPSMCSCQLAMARARARLAGRDHRVGVVEDRRVGPQPVGGRLLVDPDQPAVAGGGVDRQPRGVVVAGRVIGMDRPIGIDERLEAGRGSGSCSPRSRSRRRRRAAVASAAARWPSSVAF